MMCLQAAVKVLTASKDRRKKGKTQSESDAEH